MKEANYKFLNLRGLNTVTFVVQSLYKVLIKKFLSKKCVFKFDKKRSYCLVLHLAWISFSKLIQLVCCYYVIPMKHFQSKVNRTPSFFLTAGDSGKTDNKRLKLAYDFISSIDNTGMPIYLFYNFMIFVR